MSLVFMPDPKSKTPSVQTLGVLLFGFLVSIWPLIVSADCTPGGEGEMAIVDRVFDGDTVRLKDGRHVRILGINAPEIAHQDEPGQALGKEATDAVEAFFYKGKQVRLFYDAQRVDRYERTLAHIYDMKGNSLSAYLLRKGFGFHVAIPPNLSLNQCLQDQESVARKKRLGVWSHPQWKPIPASQLTSGDTGFKRIRGKVIRVFDGRSVWLELDGPISVKISSADLQNFSARDWDTWKGKQLEVRGWVTKHENSSGTRKKHGTNKSGKSDKLLLVQPRIGANLELLSN